MKSYQELHCVIYRRLQELAEKDPKEFKECYQLRYEKKKKYCGAAMRIAFFGSNVAECILKASTYMRKNGKWYDGSEVELLKDAIEYLQECCVETDDVDAMTQTVIDYITDNGVFWLAKQ